MGSAYPPYGKEKDPYQIIKELRESMDNALVRETAKKMVIADIEARVAELERDKARLDKLEALGEPGLGWVARRSTTGRGFRLHQDRGGPYTTVKTAREAIDEVSCE